MKKIIILLIASCLFLTCKKKKEAETINTFTIKINEKNTPTTLSTAIDCPTPWTTEKVQVYLSYDYWVYKTDNPANILYTGSFNGKIQGNSRVSDSLKYTAYTYQGPFYEQEHSFNLPSSGEFAIGFYIDGYIKNEQEQMWEKIVGKCTPSQIVDLLITKNGDHVTDAHITSSFNRIISIQ